MEIKSFNRYWIERILTTYLYIRDFTINENGSVDVNGNVRMMNMTLDKIPIKFGRVSGEFDCSHNRITSLEGCPDWVGGRFNCTFNRITSFCGAPDIVVGEFFCVDNPVFEIYKLNRKKDFVEMLNEYKVIRNEKQVIEVRLRQALEDSGCENIPEKFEFKNYQLV